ncbi:DctP family TRAP transporter solute-binding subunit [Azospirillum cavernae]|uniref:DctP family TRAP transporter solute-binding subunit n=1 Tax=Azospirillum cavernae TaxID=2320860 RepID=A0A418VQF8_9PROT|nr:DctP family TRAP transporter solute-binding subunit [Azospirillum cavernae]RJF78498.1 DctP family TRAP transporter solute-binding subunit [Azospirillum cavernae]
MNRTLAALLLASSALLATVSVAGPALADKPIIIKFSHVVAPDTPKGIAAAQFKKFAEERTGGKVVVELYPNSQLYKDKEELEALQLGAVQMLAPTASKFGPIGLKEYQAFDLPYLFPDRATVHKVTNGPIGAALLRKLESKGMVGMAFWDNGFRAISANTPLRLPTDARGLKIRINSSKVNAETIKALGGLPQTLVLSEVYQALDTGVVDGTDGPLSNLYTQKQHEVQKHVALTDHSFSAYVVVVNKPFWDGLPADIRSTLDGALKDATRINDQLAEEDERKTIDAIRNSGKSAVHTPTPDEKQAWIKALTPVQTKMAQQLGLTELVAAVNRDLTAERSQ